MLIRQIGLSLLVTSMACLPAFSQGTTTGTTTPPIAPQTNSINFSGRVDTQALQQIRRQVGSLNNQQPISSNCNSRRLQNMVRNWNSGKPQAPTKPPFTFQPGQQQSHMPYEYKSLEAEQYRRALMHHKDDFIGIPIPGSGVGVP